MSKEIALITLHHVSNYGSVLQAYATQKIFEAFGFKTTIIDYRRPWETRLGFFFYHKKGDLQDLIRQTVYFPSKLVYLKVFGSFRRKYLSIGDVTYSKKHPPKEDDFSSEIFCTGSDQVWNTGWNDGIIDAYYLSFVESKKRISYSSSFGVSSIDEDEKKEIKQYLEKYDCVSVREISGISILDSMGIYDSSLVLDPTLQLNSIKWKELIKGRMIKHKNYVLLIQLNRNKRFDRIAVDFCKANNKTLVRLCLRLDQIILPGRHAIIPEVIDYISLIEQSDCILTDSFHAVSFSINLNKDFYCVLPETYSGRIKSILTLTNLNERIIGDKSNGSFQLVHIDFDEVNAIVEQERKKGDYYIKTALNA